MIDAYLRHLEVARRLSPHSLDAYARDLARLAAFAERQSRAVAALGLPDLEAFVRGLMTEGLSPASTARCRICACRFCRVRKSSC